MSEIAPSASSIKKTIGRHTIPPRFVAKKMPDGKITVACQCGQKFRGRSAYDEHIRPVLRAAFWANWLGLDLKKWGQA